MKVEPGTKLQRLGSLEALVLGAAQPKLSVILLHGYGADAFDLASLAGELSWSPDVQWIFPQGPLSVPIGVHMQGRAWFPIDMVAHERASMTGQGVDYSQSRPKGAQDATSRLVHFLQDLGRPLEQVVLGGFSQGAMLSLAGILELGLPLRGLILLSGVLVDAPTVREKGPRLRGQRYFQSHGHQDVILPFSGAEALHQTLEACGWDGAFMDFQGGHEIPYPVVRELKSFLRAL